MLRYAPAFLLAVLVASLPLCAQEMDLPSCVEEMADAIRAGSQDSARLICQEELAPWQVTLHRHPAGWMTDGTALGVLHMPQRDDVPRKDWPTPVVLIPRSEHVWYIGSMHEGRVFPEGKAQRYFLWTPGNSRNGFGPDGVAWGYDAARMFRCLSYKGESCITYYPLRPCNLLHESRADYVLIVRRKDDLDVVTLLDTFGLVDDLVRVLSEAAAPAVCDTKE